MRILNQKTRVYFFLATIIIIISIILFEISQNNQDKLGMKILFLLSAIFLLILQFNKNSNQRNSILVIYSITAYTFLYVGFISIIFFFYPSFTTSIIGFSLALPAIISVAIALFKAVTNNKDGY